MKNVILILAIALIGCKKKDTVVVSETKESYKTVKLVAKSVDLFSLEYNLNSWVDPSNYKSVLNAYYWELTTKIDTGSYVQVNLKSGTYPSLIAISNGDTIFNQSSVAFATIRID